MLFYVIIYYPLYLAQRKYYISSQNEEYIRLFFPHDGMDEELHKFQKKSSITCGGRGKLTLNTLITIIKYNKNYTDNR